MRPDVGDANSRPAWPNRQRPEFWPGEDGHYRSGLHLDDLVGDDSRHVGRLAAWNNTWSHRTGGRLAHIAVADGTTITVWERELHPTVPVVVAVGCYRVALTDLGCFRCCDSTVRPGYIFPAVETQAWLRPTRTHRLVAVTVTDTFGTVAEGDIELPTIVPVDSPEAATVALRQLAVLVLA